MYCSSSLPLSLSLPKRPLNVLKPNHTSTYMGCTVLRSEPWTGREGIEERQVFGFVLFLDFDPSTRGC